LNSPDPNMKQRSVADLEYHFSTPVKVRLPETDAMGIVFHGNYFTYLEVGRVEYLLNLGLAEGLRPIRDFENVVVSAHLDFKSPARLHDILSVDVCTQEIRNSSFTFAVKIRHKRRKPFRSPLVGQLIVQSMKTSNPSKYPRVFVQLFRNMKDGETDHAQCFFQNNSRRDPMPRSLARRRSPRFSRHQAGETGALPGHPQRGDQSHHRDVCRESCEVVEGSSPGCWQIKGGNPM